MGDATQATPFFFLTSLEWQHPGYCIMTIHPCWVNPSIVTLLVESGWNPLWQMDIVPSDYHATKSLTQPIPSKHIDILSLFDDSPTIYLSLLPQPEGISIQCQLRINKPWFINKSFFPPTVTIWYIEVASQFNSCLGFVIPGLTVNTTINTIAFSKNLQ